MIRVAAVLSAYCQANRTAPPSAKRQARPLPGTIAKVVESAMISFATARHSRHDDDESSCAATTVR